MSEPNQDDDDDDDELIISQLAQLGIKPHFYTEEQQQVKFRQWEKDLSQGHRRPKKNVVG